MEPPARGFRHPMRADAAPKSLLLFAVAVVVRLAYIVAARPAFDSVYWTLASSLLHDGSLSVDGKIATDYEPLYPIFLAASRLLLLDSSLAVQMLQAVVASIGAVYLFRLAEALTGRRRIATGAAALFALDPLLVRHSAAPADPALATTLLIAFTYYFVTGGTAARMAIAGVSVGLVVLTRSMTLPLAAMSTALLLFERRRRLALALSAAAFVVLLPFLVRNQSLTGSLWPTRSGLNLYIGNSPYTAALLPDHDLDLLEDHAAALIAGGLSGLPIDSPEYNRAADALLTGHAWSYMKEDPLRTIAQKLWNCFYFFSPRLVPYYVASTETELRFDAGNVSVVNPASRPVLEHLIYSGFYGPVLIAAVLGVYSRRKVLGRDAILWLVALNFVAVHALYFPATRYRAPMEFVLLLYAAVAAEASPLLRLAKNHADQRFKVE
jgi:hypothetical protein